MNNDNSNNLSSQLFLALLKLLETNQIIGSVDFLRTYQ